MTMPKSSPIWLAIALAAGAMATGFAVGDGAEEQWSAATRFTARVGFPLLILAYIARPLVQLTKAPWAKQLLRQRKYIGLGFALTHTVHLVAIVMLYRTLGELPELIAVLGGGFAYVLLFAMAITSNQQAMKLLGKRWKQLHWAGIHYLWFIFLQSYAGRITQPETALEGVLFTAVALAAAGIRFAAWRRNSKAQSSA